MDVSAIKRYILYLREREGLSVSLHPLRPEAIIFAGDLMIFNIHDNPYCVAVKASPLAQKHCINCQEKVLEKCREGTFCGRCYAGVTEYVYPINDGMEVIGFISVSGYGDEVGKTYVHRLAAQYNLSDFALITAYHALNTHLPPRERVDTLILPLVDMLELAYRKVKPILPTADSLYEQIVRYLKQHRGERVTSQDLCAAFYCSRSQIAHLFKKNAGCSIPEYLNALRVEDAKHLLAHADLDIATVASAVGFSDRQYFSTVFRQSVGVSPREYRRQHKKD